MTPRRAFAPAVVVEGSLSGTAPALEPKRGVMPSSIPGRKPPYAVPLASQPALRPTDHEAVRRSGMRRHYSPVEPEDDDDELTKGHRDHRSDAARLTSSRHERMDRPMRISAGGR